MTRDVVIVQGLRTPFVRAGEDLRQIPVDELARSCSRDLLDRSEIAPEQIDELIRVLRLGIERTIDDLEKEGIYRAS